MTDRITIPCTHCGDELVFGVESWADPPERAFCDDTCHEAAKQAASTPTTV